MFSLDRLDRKILKNLQEDATTSFSVLGERVGLSLSACHKRVQRLKSDGFITGQTYTLSERKLGYKTNAIVRVTLVDQTKKTLEAFEKSIVKIPFVMDCYLMSGSSDYLLRFLCESIEEFEKLHREVLAELPGVTRLETSFSLRTVCNRRALPLES
jgi:Lrp/AsnC family leucine-responsive transcriptional regulator